jgi:hypothetical protein
MPVNLIETGIGQSTDEPAVERCFTVIKRLLPGLIIDRVINLNRRTGGSVKSFPALDFFVKPNPTVVLRIVPVNDRTSNRAMKGAGIGQRSSTLSFPILTIPNWIRTGCP